VPENLVLDWKKEQLSLDVVLRDVSINEFDPSRRTVLFVEPTLGGYARVNLAELTRQKSPEGPTDVRETLPVPEPRNRRRSSPRLQIQQQSSNTKPLLRADQDLPKDAAVLLPVFNPELEEVVGAPLPIAPGASVERAASAAWQALPSIER
jgi:hypothetical protein